MIELKNKRIFIVGDEWLYYKLYCGERTSDHILIETIQPLVLRLLDQELINHWFFIRFNDPDFHIRIRFHLTDLKHIGAVILNLNKELQPYVVDDIIYKIQLDTYLREIERYGTHTIEFSEKLFYKESTMLLKAIELIPDHNLFFLFVIKAIDTILGNFNYSVENKLQLTQLNRDAFKREFNADKKLTKQLDKKYRELKTELFLFFSLGSRSEEYKMLDSVLAHYTDSSANETKKILVYLSELQEVSKDNLISSYIHMLVNRAFRSKQRFYELVCYDFLNKYYKNIMFSRKPDLDNQ